MDAIHAEPARRGAAPSGTDGAAAGGIAAADARLDSLEAALQRVEGALLALDASLRNAETTVANGTFGGGRAGPAAIPATLHEGTERYTVTFGHFGDSVRGMEQGPGIAGPTIAYAFSCRADVFVGRVVLGDPTLSLWGRARTANPAIASVATVEGTRLRDRQFDPGNGTGIPYRPASHDFNLMELKAGGTLDFKSTFGGNHTNGTSNSGYGICMAAKRGEGIPANKLPPFHCDRPGEPGQIGPFKGVPGPYTKAQMGAPSLREHRGVPLAGGGRRMLVQADERLPERTQRGAKAYRQSGRPPPACRSTGSRGRWTATTCPPR